MEDFMEVERLKETSKRGRGFSAWTGKDHSLVVASQGYSLVVGHGLLVSVASLVAVSRCVGSEGCGSRA